MSAFKCPHCGASTWGSSRLSDGTWQRHCHGFGCRYSWHERDDAANGIDAPDTTTTACTTEKP